MRVASSAFPGLLGLWGEGVRRATGVVTARASDFDRSDAVLLAMTGAVYDAEETCIRDKVVFRNAAEAAAPFLFGKHAVRRGRLNGIDSEYWTPTCIVDRLCDVHEKAANVASLPALGLGKVKAPRSPRKATGSKTTDNSVGSSAADVSAAQDDELYTTFCEAFRAGVVRALSKMSGMAPPPFTDVPAAALGK